MTHSATPTRVPSRVQSRSRSDEEDSRHEPENTRVSGDHLHPAGRCLPGPGCDEPERSRPGSCTDGTGNGGGVARQQLAEGMVTLSQHRNRKSTRLNSSHVKIS